MGRGFAPLGLDEVERAELTSLASRRSTAQALALRARISASGVGASPSVGLKVFGMSRDRGHPALSRMPESRR